MSERERREVFYSGAVQGVGFRYTARQLASGFAVTGFVRNLPDGRVQMVAEGQPTEIDRFLAAVAGAMTHYVDSADQSTHPATGEFDHFAIRH